MELTVRTIFVTHPAPEYVVLLGVMWLILLCAGFAPRPLTLVRLALRAAGAMLAGEVARWAGIILAAAALAIASAMPAPAAAAETCAPALAAPAAATGDDPDPSVAEAYLRVTARSMKPMPVWLLDAAARIYEAYQASRAARRAKEAARIARAALAEIAQVRAEIEAGRVLGENQQRILRTRLEAQGAAIDGLGRRVAEVERRTQRLERSTEHVARIATRRGCPSLHAWDRKLQRCTNRQ